MQRSVCKISFLPLALKLSARFFNNSVQAVSRDTPGRQCAAAHKDTYSFSQSEWGREEDVLREVAYFRKKMVCICAAFIFIFN